VKNDDTLRASRASLSSKQATSVSAAVQQLPRFYFPDASSLNSVSAPSSFLRFL